MSEHEKVVSQGEAIATLARRGEDPETLGLLASLFDRNARDQAWLVEQLLLGEQHAHAQTKRRLAAAEARLARIEDRHAWLLGYGPDDYAEFRDFS